MKQLIYLALVIVCGAALLKWVSKRPVPTFCSAAHSAMADHVPPTGPCSSMTMTTG